MGWESSDEARFDLGPLLQGQRLVEIVKNVMTYVQCLHGLSKFDLFQSSNQCFQKLRKHTIKSWQPYLKM